MIKYCQDPINNPKPTMRVTNIKEYKDVAETLYKIVSGATPGAKDKRSPMFDALSPPQQPAKKEDAKPAEQDAASILVDAMSVDGEDTH